MISKAIISRFSLLVVRRGHTKTFGRMDCGSSTTTAQRFRPQQFSTRSRGSQRQKQDSGQESKAFEEMNSNVALKSLAVAVLVFGVSYASVPLYKVFCQMTGFGGTTQRVDESSATTVKPVDGGKVLRVDFTCSVHSEMPWKFKPTQKFVKVVPGETALAFYTVKNTASVPITGVATYNVHPPKSGLYFNKIQCFCFEEQRLRPGEEIDMPVFFFIDPEFADDPAMESTNSIVLSYCFFKTGEEQPEDEDEDEDEEMGEKEKEKK
jgi:cytochrome c oxidase assembly protein subunit 11